MITQRRRALMQQGDTLIFDGASYKGDFDGSNGSSMLIHTDRDKWSNANPMRVKPNTTYLIALSGEWQRSLFNLYEYRGDGTLYKRNTGAGVGADVPFVVGDETRYINLSSFGSWVTSQEYAEQLGLTFHIEQL